MDSSNLGGKAGRLARQTANKADGTANEVARNEWVHRLGRLGYATRGIVYLLVGGLATVAALGHGGQLTDKNGALRIIHDQPLGQLLLGIVTVGLFGYALWSLIKAIADTENKGTDPKGIVVRISYAVIALSYGFLAFTALQLLLGSGNGGQSSDTKTQDWTARFLNLPFGQALVVIAGLIVLGAAAAEFYQAYKAKPLDHLNQAEMSPKMRQGAKWFCQIGLASLGVVIGLIGLFLIIAALQHNPSQAKGLGGALQELAKQPYGQVLLCLVSLGLAIYGVYSLFEARYHQFTTSRTRRTSK
ncbi:MAG TPA: DUF1206 domain-containing protein [Chloroflexia bacterium]|nr:DUF1206 domain-containing protein [Chloroflexia bacterium]